MSRSRKERRRKYLSRRTRFEVLKRDNFTCRYCGRKPPMVYLVVDHIVAVSSGGGHDFDNLGAACYDCNSGKSDVALTIGKGSARDIEVGVARTLRGEPPTIETIERLSAEGPITMSEAAKIFGLEAHRFHELCIGETSIVTGAMLRLESFFVGARLCTSRQAFIRFVAAFNGAEVSDFY